jgi:deoxyribodipyrimidine photo-lyase
MWFRNDLRVADNPALHAASDAHQVVAVFLLADKQWQAHFVAPRRLAFLRESIRELQKDLNRLNIPLVIAPAARFSDAPAALLKIADDWQAQQIFCNSEYPLNEQNRDRHVADACSHQGIGFHQYHGGVILPPGSVMTASGDPYTVFTPFKRRWLSTLNPDDWTPLPEPDAQAELSAPAQSPAKLDSQNLELLDQLPQGDDQDWPAGATAAQQRLSFFIDRRVHAYQAERDFPAKPATSRLSPYLSIGSLSARQALAAARTANDNLLNAKPDANPGLDTWISELIWREFYRHVTAAFPRISKGRAFKTQTDALTWRHDPEQFDRWCLGMTGYPIVDAGMRQLNATGWMHNRLRMVTAMFLSKHLLLDWRLGERYFMEHLIDGDFAANNGGWQWSSSTGTDAVPYFRIFNPTSQAKKFDTEEEFIREWVPEIDGLAGSTPAAYPAPMVDHTEARKRALAFFKKN